MNATPIAADDSFTADQGEFTTVITGHLGADNGNGADSDPDGSLLGWAGPGFTTAGDGVDLLGAFFSNGQLGFLSLQHSGYVTFPVFSTVLALTTAEGGRVILHTNGTFTYTAPAGFSGVDWFDYSLVDAEYATDIGRVTFTVLDTAEGNDRPEARDDHFTGNEDQPISGNLLADNGNGVDTDSNGDALSVVNRTTMTARGGVVSVYANGDFVYRPPANYNGPDSFTYTVKDIHGASRVGTVTLAIAAIDDAPVAVNDSFSTVHDRPATGNVLDNDRDPEGGALQVLAAVIATAAGGEVHLLADGSFTYVPSPGFVGLDSFTYTAVDPAGNSATASAALSVTNAAPVATADWFTAKFGQGLSGNVLANNGTGADRDVDGDALAVTPATLVTTRGGTVNLLADGRFAYQPAEAFHGTDSFQYTVSDGFGGVATATAFITTAAPAGSVFGNADDNAITGTAVSDKAFGLDGDDIILGHDGNDILAGGGDKDTLDGGNGADKLYGQAGKDVLRGGTGKDYLSGGLDSDDLYGDGGADILSGGAGIDSYYGGGGYDLFVFDAANGTSHDRVMDFRTGDLLAVKASDYGLSAGALPDASYLALAGAADVDHGRFLYTAANRSLAWDADGDASTANVVIAVFDRQVSLSHTDFVVI